jgi:hypothetical protein
MELISTAVWMVRILCHVVILTQRV